MSRQVTGVACMTVALQSFTFCMSRLPSASAPTQSTNKLITQRHVHLNRAWKTPQFWLIWVVLCMNVTAGIGVLSMASPMLQDVFGGKLLGLSGTTDLTTAQKAAIAASAAGLVGLISLFNSLGRLFWASTSDFLGRKRTYFVFFALGIVLYCLLPTLGHMGLAAMYIRGYPCSSALFCRENYDTFGAPDLFRSVALGFFLLLGSIAIGAYLRHASQQQVETETDALIRAVIEALRS